MKRLFFALTMAIFMLASTGTVFAGEADSVQIEQPELGLKDKIYNVKVNLEGGSGRATVESPTTLFVQNGKGILHVTWSSPNYDYMIVNGEKYLQVNKEGNSEFDIPMIGKLDEPFTVVADTVAMSKPHEIEYTLTVSVIHSKLSTILISCGIGLIVASIILMVIKKRAK